MNGRPFFEELKLKEYGKVIKTVSLASLLEESKIVKKSPFHNWKEIVGAGLAENSYPLYFDKNGTRLIAAVSHSSFQITMKFIDGKIIDGLKKNRGCENLKENLPHILETKVNLIGKLRIELLFQSVPIHLSSDHIAYTVLGEPCVDDALDTVQHTGVSAFNRSVGLNNLILVIEDKLSEIIASLFLYHFQVPPFRQP